MAGSSATYLSWTNWKQPVDVVYRWQTSIFNSSGNDETRRILRLAPSRDVSYTTFFAGEDQIQQAVGLIQSLTQSRQYLPLPMDVTRLDSALSDTGTILSCDTTYRNFQVGHYIVVAHNTLNGVGDGYGTATSQYYPAKIQAKTDTTITVETTIGEAFSVGALVFPAFLAEIDISGDLKLTGFAEQSGTVSVKQSEVYGSDTLPIANSSYSPTTYDGFDYLPFDLNWRSSPKMSFRRPGDKQSSGRYQVFDYYSDNPLATLSFTASAMSQADCWTLRGMLNKMRGRYNVFWVKGPMDYLSVGATQTTAKIDLDSKIPQSPKMLLHGLYIEDADGNFEFRRGSMQKVSETYTFWYNTARTIGTVTKVRPAYLMRSDKDGILATWFTPGVMEVGLDLIEVTEAYG